MSEERTDGIAGYWDHRLCVPVPQPALTDTVDMETLEATPQDLSHTFPLRLPPVSVRPETKHATSSTRLTLATKRYKLDHEPEDEVELALFNVQSCVIPKNHKLFKHAEGAVVEWAHEIHETAAARTLRARNTPWKATDAARTPGDTTVGVSTPEDTTIGVSTPCDTTSGGQSPGDTTLDKAVLGETSIDETIGERTALAWQGLAETALAGIAQEDTAQAHAGPAHTVRKETPPKPPLVANPLAEATQKATTPQAQHPLFALYSHSLPKGEGVPVMNRASLTDLPSGPKLCIEIGWSNGWANLVHCAHIFKLRVRFDGSIMAEPIQHGIPRVRYPYAAQ